MSLVFSSWFFWLMLTLTITIFLPDAANVFILPLTFASILLFLATFLKEEKPTNILTFDPSILRSH
ncbi:MAG: hypothetical protein Ct9H300mP3_08900 [Gammaproteobacteria bacterium]|nr:MAG: hypothetical protein Ct9H300mP3_08900 [Gammaproteobacteria bacterium]